MFGFFFFVGACYTALAWAIVAVLPVRRIFGLKNQITERHLDVAGIALLVCALIVTCGYLLEVLFAWYGHSRSEWDPTEARLLESAFRQGYCFLVLTNSILPMFLWFRRVRRNDILLFLIALMVPVGLWVERLAILRSMAR